MPILDPITGKYILTEEDAMGGPMAGAPRVGPFQDPAVAQVTGMVPGAVNPNMALDPEASPQAATPQEELAGMPTYSTPSSAPGVEERIDSLETFVPDTRDAIKAESEEENQTEEEGLSASPDVPTDSVDPERGAKDLMRILPGVVQDTAVAYGLAEDPTGELIESDQLSTPTQGTPKDTVQEDIAKAQSDEQARLDAINAQVQDPQFDVKQTDAKLRQLEELNKIDKDVAKFQREKAEEIYKAAEADVKSYHEYTEKLKGDMEAKIKEIEAMRVNPAQLFDNIGTAGTIGMALSAGVGQMLAMKHGTPNTALQIIDKAIERNINAQVQNIQNQHKVVGLQRGLLETAGDVMERKAMARKRATAEAYAFAEATAAEKIANLPETQQVKTLKVVEELRNNRIKAQQDFLKAAEESAIKQAKLRIEQADAETRQMTMRAKLAGDERKRRLRSGNGSGGNDLSKLHMYPGNTMGERLANFTAEKRATYAKKRGIPIERVNQLVIAPNNVKGRSLDQLVLVSDKGNLATDSTKTLNQQVEGAAALMELERVVGQLQEAEAKNILTPDHDQFAKLQASWDQALRAYTTAVGGYGAIGKDESLSVNGITGRTGNEKVSVLDFAMGNVKLSHALDGIKSTRAVLLNRANTTILSYDPGVPAITEDQLNPRRIVGPLDEKRNALANAGLQEVTSSRITDAFELVRQRDPEADLKGFEQGFDYLSKHVADKVNPKGKGTVADHRSRLKSAVADLDNYRKKWGDDVFSELGLDATVSDIKSDINSIDRYYQVRSAMGKKVEKLKKEDFSEAMALQMGLNTYKDDFTVGDATLNRTISRAKGATRRHTTIERVEPIEPPTKAAQKGASKGKDTVKEALSKIMSITELAKARKKKKQR